MTNIAIIPARKGSKRIKKKNIILFNGKPMIYWTILAARKSKIFKKIYVDTDCKEIKRLSLKYGAEVPFLRKKKYANNKVNVNLSTFQFLLNLKKINTDKIINVFQLMPNCPYRDANDIKSLYKKFKKNKSKFLISHVRFYFSNPWWSVLKKKDKIIRLFKNTYKKRSQDLHNLFCPSGAIWIAKYGSFLKAKTFYGKNYQLGILEWKKGIDIDSKEELEICKELIK